MFSKRYPASEPSDTRSLRVAEVISALSQALDLGSGSTRWHSVRTCIVGMRLAAELRLPVSVQADLFYALLLKDAGCSSNASEIHHALASDDIAAKRDVKKTDSTRLSWETLQYALTHVLPGKPVLERLRAMGRIAARQKRHTRHVTAIRCERGATLAKLMGLSANTAEGIRSLDEHWNGSGHPEGLRGQTIPITSRIMLLSQTLDVFYTDAGSERAIEVINERCGTWFDPEIVRAARSLAKRQKLWAGIDGESPMELALSLEPVKRTMSENDVNLDAVCQAFAQIVDAKSPFTYNHSNGVANAAIAIAKKLELPPARVLFVRHAALLHDLGKMAVSNSILEKPGKPDDNEWQILRTHPAQTWNILRCVQGFEQLSEVAASHHEKLDGSGYHRGLTEDRLSIESRILAVSDIFDALAAPRPYRDPLPRERVLQILRRDTPHALDPACVEALEQSGTECDQSFQDLYALQESLGFSVSSPHSNARQGAVALMAA